MIESNIKSPGVYINEQNAFPNSVVSVATAVPAFIGYTPQAVYEGKSYTNVALILRHLQARLSNTVLSITWCSRKVSLLVMIIW
jgi:phage tail sheath protein FI